MSLYKVDDIAEQTCKAIFGVSRRWAHIQYDTEYEDNLVGAAADIPGGLQ